SNRRIRLLQSPALPLGYPAVGSESHNKATSAPRKPLFIPSRRQGVRQNSSGFESKLVFFGFGDYNTSHTHEHPHQTATSATNCRRFCHGARQTLRLLLQRTLRRYGSL